MIGITKQCLESFDNVQMNKKCWIEWVLGGNTSYHFTVGKK